MLPYCSGEHFSGGIFPLAAPNFPAASHIFKFCFLISLCREMSYLESWLFSYVWFQKFLLTLIQQMFIAYLWMAGTVLGMGKESHLGHRPSFQNVRSAVEEQDK